MAGMINCQLRLVVVVMMLLKSLLLLLQGRGSNACLEEERVALLQLKASFYCPYCAFSNGMRTWRKDVDCCWWDGVGCNATTGRVYELILDDFRYGEPVDNWLFNASVFLPFQELRRLSLRGNSIVCCVENEGFERLASTINLEYLDLSYNKLGNAILPFVAGFLSLKSLYISEIGLMGTSGIEELQKLQNLETLDLGLNDLNNSILTLLHGLDSLRTLDISYTRLKGSINIKDLVVLFNMEELYIGGNKIDKFIVHKDIEGESNISILWLNNGVCDGSNFQLESLKAFSKLESLHLENNSFTGLLFPRELDNVNELYLNDSSWDENFLQSLGALRFLRTLSMQMVMKAKNLQLPFQSLSNSTVLLQSIANMTSLETLSLAGRGLTGSIQGLCHFTNLRVLDLACNYLSGNLPHCLVNLTLLQRLCLACNHFTGKVSQSPLKGLTSITSLKLRDNQFEIPSSLSPFVNNSKLKYFNANGNEVYTEIDVVNRNLAPKFQLESLWLSSTSREGSFLEFLYHQHDLQLLCISGIPMIRFGFPGWLLENNTKLESLRLSNCSLLGSLGFSTRNPNATLKNLDISRNHLYGHIPSEMCTYFPRLRWLDLSENEFTGSIPKSLSNCSFLKTFAVRDNKLFDKIPKWIATMDALKVLDLSKNMLFGSIPTILGTSQLQQIFLSENILEGPFPRLISNPNNLQVLDLSHNCLIGIIPKWIEKFYMLRYLLLSHNNFVGEIPINLWKMKNKLKVVDLSHNKLSVLSTNYSCKYKNETFGDILYSIGEFDFVVKGNIFGYKMEQIVDMNFIGLDLSNNNLKDRIPYELGNIQGINLLNLSHNSLFGPISFSLSNMSKIETLDLSYNKLSGTIPHQLTELNFLEVFNVSYNNLSGKTPDRVAQFATFDESSYEGNSFLCGLPLPKNCTLETTTTTSSNDDEVNDGFVDMNAFYISFFVTFAIILVTLFAVMYINSYWRRTWFYFIETTIDSCCNIFVDNFSFLSKLWMR